MPRRYLRDMHVYSGDEIDEEYEEVFLSLIKEEELTQGMTRKRWRGSVMGHNIVERESNEGHERLYRDYFADRPKYGPRFFRTRFRMKRALFLRIHDVVLDHDSYFFQKRNAAKRLGLSSLQKVTAAFRMLAYGVPAHYTDEYIQIGKSTAIESLKHFVKAVVDVFGEEYLRSPNTDDIARLFADGEKRGFPGLLGSIDCMHWIWKNCPTTWHGMYTGHIHEPTIILEAVSSYDLWIWHAFFGLLGSLNDINVLDRSFVFSELGEGRVPNMEFMVNGRTYNMGYYLADGIYPPCATVVKTIPAPRGNKNKHFATEQEAARKDVERAFGVLKQRFAIIRGPGRFWDKDTLKDIMTACIIMHNMIVEDERDEPKQRKTQEYEKVDEIPNISESFECTPSLIEFIENHHRIKDKQMHSQLQQDLISTCGKKKEKKNNSFKLL